MIEHLPWVGEHANIGIAGQRIALMGYSHHGDDDDDEQFTVETIEALIHEPAKPTLGNLG